MRARATVGKGLDRLAPRLGAAARARYGGSREAEMVVLPRLVRTGDTVVDVGAHRGVYTWHLARLVGTSGRVHAFEPQADLASYLDRAFRATLQVKVHNRALSNRAGKAVLTIPKAAGHASLEPVEPGDSVEVDVAPLDALAVSPSFMKIDVESHEASVIMGALTTIRRCRPALLIEIERRAASTETQREQLLALLGDLGYGPAVLTTDRKVSCFDVARLADASDPIAPDRYAYNFFFFPAGSAGRTAP